MSVEESDLALITTEAMLAELEKRFSHMGFVGRVDDALGPERHRREFRWAGNGMMTLGLLTYLEHNILKYESEHVAADPCDSSGEKSDEDKQ